MKNGKETKKKEEKKKEPLTKEKFFELLNKAIRPVNEKEKPPKKEKKGTSE